MAMTGHTERPSQRGTQRGVNFMDADL